MLATRTESFNERTTCGDAFDWFVSRPDVSAAAIVDSQSGAILGLINRFIFFARYARQFVPELFRRKPILNLANPAPLIVDQEVLIADLGATLLMENPDALFECFVVTQRGRYLGIGTGEALLRDRLGLHTVRCRVRDEDVLIEVPAHDRHLVTVEQERAVLAAMAAIEPSLLTATLDPDAYRPGRAFVH